MSSLGETTKVYSFGKAAPVGDKFNASAGFRDSVAYMRDVEWRKRVGKEAISLHRSDELRRQAEKDDSLLRTGLWPADRYAHVRPRLRMTCSGALIENTVPLFATGSKARKGLVRVTQGHGASAGDISPMKTDAASFTFDSSRFETGDLAATNRSRRSQMSTGRPGTSQSRPGARPATSQSRPGARPTTSSTYRSAGQQILSGRTDPRTTGRSMLSTQRSTSSTYLPASARPSARDLQEQAATARSLRTQAEARAAALQQELDGLRV